MTFIFNQTGIFDSILFLRESAGGSQAITVPMFLATEYDPDGEDGRQLRRIDIPGWALTNLLTHLQNAFKHTKVWICPEERALAPRAGVRFADGGGLNAATSSLLIGFGGDGPEAAKVYFAPVTLALSKFLCEGKANNYLTVLETDNTRREFIESIMRGIAAAGLKPTEVFSDQEPLPAI